MKQEQIDRILRSAENLLFELPRSLVKMTDPEVHKLSRKDVVGTAFAHLLIGAGINPYDFKPNPKSESYLRPGHSHTSEMGIWHFHSSVRDDKSVILKKFKKMLALSVKE